MPIEIAVSLMLFAVLVVGSLIYAIIRLWREPPPPDVSPKAQRLARLFRFPKLFDGLLARPMTRREIFGWLLYAIILVLAVTFMGKS